MKKKYLNNFMKIKNNELRNANGLKKVTLPTISNVLIKTKTGPESLQAYKAPGLLI
jgi:hypothetical protein